MKKIKDEPWSFTPTKQMEFKIDFPSFEEFCNLSDEERENLNKQKWEKMKQELRKPNKPIDSGFAVFLKPNK